MAQNGQGWTFEQIKDPEYTELAEKYGVKHPKLGWVDLSEVKP